MSQKEDNFTWTLQTCLDLLKSKDNMPKVIVTSRDTTLINVVAKYSLNLPFYCVDFIFQKTCESKMHDKLQNQIYGCQNCECQKERFLKRGWRREGYKRVEVHEVS